MKVFMTDILKYAISEFSRKMVWVNQYNVYSLFHVSV